MFELANWTTANFKPATEGGKRPVPAGPTGKAAS
jgi:hypothetical protein